MAAPGRPVLKGPARFHARVLELRSFADAAAEVARTASEPEGVGIMTRKSRTFPIRLDGVSLKASPLLKQELLAVGGDSAHARGIADHSVERSEVVLLATWGQYRRLIPKLERQPFGLAEIGKAIDAALANRVRRAERLVKGLHHSFTVGGHTLVMGVVNITPDSFSDGGRFLEPSAAVAQALHLGAEGADILDLGGESTRPGATPVSAEEEWRRVGPVLAGLRGLTDLPISIDTRNAEIAERALAAGADLINDVGGLRTPEMRRLVARTGAPVIVLHMRGDPATMQTNVEYNDVRGEVFGALSDACALAEAEGIAPGQFLIDPGLGFGKTSEQSLELLAHLAEFRSLGPPVVVGASRKSFLGWALEGAGVGERTEAGLAAAVAAALGGADIVRVHEVATTVKALKLADHLRGTRDTEVEERTVDGSPGDNPG
ncbi:MAG: dihydropteroate synthase [Thermoplasmata archaeon]|nr:dihydropteroate synthase [Thermoplasmata archaeon]